MLSRFVSGDDFAGCGKTLHASGAKARRILNRFGPTKVVP
jgi:hypothetical protein